MANGNRGPGLHRCLEFGKLGDFAAGLKKGAHIQVEGELRSREEPEAGNDPDA